MTARLAGLLPGALDEQQTEVYHAITAGPRAAGPQAFALVDEEGRMRGPFNAMLLSPPVGLAVQAVGTAVRYESVLTDRVREMAILVVAAEWGSGFEREAHEEVGRRCGLTESELRALRADGLPDLADPAERAALNAVVALTCAGALSDQEYYDTVAAWGERGLFELTTLVGYYALLALQLRVFAGEGPADHYDTSRTESGTS
ncbi:carboxymuconolactone decarboxylase family protein [Streptomyces sp. SP18BB07]|uniref:carboxymuconolactone decarboxylase family protein n=1 Tax=Streptomyces sp. SP18BB07 TaxID=3002522 RepID=UPI002E7A75E5|nr:carboxymuconolactone decarboxylase family protein [Streptomyces sp. SP18BB07]MEE1765124.1 carboxymuconolactone decarboxylase family protein [Streptomyces sp. SP18BB07]